MSFSFIAWLFISLCGSGHADRPGELSAVLSEISQRAHGKHCEDILQTIETKMGVERKEWIEGQSASFEAALRPLFAVLPHGSHGNTGRLGLEMARYALHRVFVDARGWNVNGLEESNLHGVRNASTLPLQSILRGQVPPEVEAAFRQCFATDVGIKDLGLLAASLDELVHQEVLQRAKNVFKAKKLPMFGHIDLKQMQEVLEQVMMGYICDSAGIQPEEREKYLSGELDIREKYPSWPSLQQFLHSLQDVMLPAQATRFHFKDLTGLVKELNEHYGRWQDGECQVLSNELKDLEAQCPGHINLRQFYSSHLHQNKWQFTESVQYLRSLGALEESETNQPRLISTNYVLGANNCVSTSQFYSQCCVNQCDAHLRKLEKAVAQAEVPADDLQAAITAVLPEPDPEGLFEKLQEIAKRHGGKVTLHGLQFAEWLHHAYPRECPAPKFKDQPEELSSHFESRTHMSSTFSDADMEAYLESHNVAESQKCHIPWTEEVPNVPLQARRLQEMTPSGGSTSWWAAFAAVSALGSLVTARVVTRNEMNAEAPTDPMA